MRDPDAPPVPSTYAAAGVDLAAADDAMARIRTAVTSTYTPNVLRGLGAFGGLFALPDDVERPVLVASTDGVGTKTGIALARGAVRGIGRDLVHHCVNDVLVQGARPLFFLDYVASARLEPSVVAEVVGGVADACRASGIALLGGETAEMPGVYAPGELDVVGTIVGIVGRADVIDGSAVRAGDVLLALASGGLQTNGFSLARAVAQGHLDEPVDPSDPAGPTLADALLAEHRSFMPSVRPLLDAGLVRALAHVTGGGIPGNLPRALPDGLGAEVDPSAWVRPPVFARLQALGEIGEGEMRSVFNLGVGMIVVVRADDVEAARACCPEPLTRIGAVVAGAGVRFLDDR
jgi:phosphoribosylformylglycinamidine cyclo-ligase